MHRVVAGVVPLEPGYRKILVKPQPGGDLTWASAGLGIRLVLASPLEFGQKHRFLDADVV